MSATDRAAAAASPSARCTAPPHHVQGSGQPLRLRNLSSTALTAGAVITVTASSLVCERSGERANE